MSQYDISEFLKKNYPTRYSARDLAEQLKIQYSTIFNQLNNLVKCKTIIFKEAVTQGTGKRYKIYQYFEVDDDFKLINKEFNQLRIQDGINSRPFEYYQNLQIIKELKLLNKKEMK